MTKKDIKIKNRDDLIDKVEKMLIDSGSPIAFPLVHRFTDNMYIREITMPKGSLLTSKIHNTNHPFVVTKGKCKVFDGDDVMDIEAPYTGITEKDTRRVLYIEEETVWTTFHVTDKKDVDEIEKEIIKPHENNLVDKKIYENIKKITVSNEKTINKKGEKLCLGQ
tara:strand:+ start:826 stop:1320 length:495 start_codon:yes stop_codon:yes gene_type:complete